MAPRYPTRPAPNSKLDKLDWQPVLCYICHEPLGLKGQSPAVKVPVSGQPPIYVHQTCQ